MKLIHKSILLAAAAVAVSVPAGAKSPVHLTEKNIDKVLHEMTLDEKAKMLVGYTFGRSYWGLPSDPDPDAGAIVLGAAGNTAKIERLGIPHTVLADGPAGVHISAERPGTDRTFYCTGFPIGTLIAASWDTGMAHRIGDALGSEMLDYGVDVILGPGMNLMRNPMCGRNFEYFSEDPLLSGMIAANWINGVQQHGVGTSPKHFAVNNQEGNRNFNNALVDQRALRELYLKNFEIMVRNSEPWTIMSSYNRINGEYTQESHDLLTKILRNDWGYDGIVMTDWTGTRNTQKQVTAGNDLLTPGNAEQIQQIIDGVKAGNISMADVDRNVRRILEYVVKTPRFKGAEYSEAPDLKANAAVVRSAAPEGMVLLKNDDSLLPFTSADKKKVALFGATSYNFIGGGSGSGDVNKPYVVDLVQGLQGAGFELDSVLTGVYGIYRDFVNAEAESEMGALTTNSYFPRPRVAEASMGKYTYQNAADRNDIAIVTIGRKSGEGGDRLFKDFDIYPDELEMLRGISEAFHAKGKKVVAILNVGGAIETAPVAKYCDAILLTWQPGLEAGNSVADVLTGASYPSGKLPMTWPVALADVPSTADFPDNFDWRDEMSWGRQKIDATPNLGTTHYNEGLNVGYRYFTTADAPVAYPFGFGMGYTTFGYSDPKIVRKGDKYIATVTVTNTGSRAGREAVQLYVTAPKGKLDKPVRELRAFAKTKELAPGESQTLQMTFTNYDLASFDPELHAFVTDAGTYKAHFAASANDIRHTVDFKGKAAVRKVTPALLMKK